ncbi:type VII secretion protein EccCa [Spirilliplanes yamanashiensis]|uniref:Type VII secretion protein EccC n=1 Tax=Spirilliplanes yamanashiensis TaxID=42233 RepID=A0A8J3Y6J3_9ACTN|nr:type VII secretion protein EccCa [Spirilliplanes yamanashiensis]MDP9814615.1 S-DNA-T family DNA segregation ATPase FtsK/SpoIIIE [Spirilliplanes yamanashiensis]GIJ02267.1 type VII secretion protein EccC [Spirilliplanes yamanashiensis]
MSTVVVRRSARRPEPEIPTGEITVEAPPEIPQATGARWQQLLMVLPMLGGSVAMAMMMGGQGSGGGTRAYSYVVGGLFGISSLAMLATSFSSSGSPKKTEMMAARREYLRHLASLRRRVRQTADRQRSGLFYRHPDPAQLWSTANSHRLWERRAADPDFGVVRVAVGPQMLATPLIPPQTRPLEDLEPMTAGALRRFLDAYSVVPDLPVAVSLRAFATVFLRGGGHGADADARALTRAMLVQLATFHAPDDLLVAVCAGPDRRELWEWTKWLPHAQHPSRMDALGPVRLVASAGEELERIVEDVIGNRRRFGAGTGQLDGPHVVIVLDGAHLEGATQLDDGLDGVTVLDLDARPPRMLDRSMLVLEVAGRQRALNTYAMEHEATVGTADRLTIAEAEGIARRLAPLRLAARSTSSDAPLATDMGLAELLGIADPEGFNVQQGWAPRPNRDRLRVPIGIAADGSPIELDLKESAQDGMGPHGLLIGATGSGKSELLRTLVLALAATHSSETLNFVLIDFKGGATFSSLDRLPHTAAVITNLKDELPLVDRMVDAIEGEMTRRQEVLRKAGNYASLRDYEKARAGGAPLAPLPSLLIICDEFSELLTAKPDFIDLFVSIGRLGRSLGVHLLLASQRLEEGRLRGLDTHLSYRIGLKTFSALESRAVLGVPDAYELPSSPGHGYLKFGTEALNRFKAAYVSGSFRAAGRGGAGFDGERDEPRVLAYTTHHQAIVEPAKKPAPQVQAAGGRSLLDVMVDRLAGQGPPAHQVWLPPLVTSPALDELLGPVTVDPARGLAFANPELHGALQVPVALIDKPAEQRRDVMWFQLGGAAGHVAVVGGPQSGKSTSIRTIISGLALTHTPREVQIYCLDFGGGALNAVRELPHVGGVAGRLDGASVRRTIGEVMTLLNAREQRFADHGIESMAAYRKRRAAAAGMGQQLDDPYGDVFLVIDGWATLRKDYDDLEPVVTDLATRGLSYGIHVIAGASRWMDFRPAIRDLFGSRLELRLGDPSDSIVPRKLSQTVPENTPGRGITPNGKDDALHILAVKPEVASLGESADLVKACAAAWQGPGAPQVRLLPAEFPYSALDLSATSGLVFPIGLAEHNMAQVSLDFAAEPHFLLFGDSECGKSSVLRSIATTISRRFEPDRCRMIIVDYRRSLFDTDSPNRMRYVTQAAEALELMQSVAGYMENRLPKSDITPEQLRDRSWWEGPELFVLVDDYDLVTGGTTNPLQPLLEYIPHARDIGLHLVLARRAGGASRAAYEPFIQRLRELSTPGLVMAGDPNEGALVGPAKPAPLPPGRGRLVTRREGVRLIQVAHQPPPTL